MSADVQSIAANVTDALARGEKWLDDHGTGAWIIAIVAGFMVFPPIGLALLIWVGFARSLYRNRAGREIEVPARTPAADANTAYDAHRAESLDQLDDEQSRFESFVDQVRTRRDRDDFDAYLDARAGNGNAADR